VPGDRAPGRQPLHRLRDTGRPTPVGGAVVDRKYQPLSCSNRCGETERYHTDAMARVFDRCEWLLAEAMTLRVDMLPRW
jgi:hypothetical protein